MNKNVKLGIIIGLALILLVWQLAMFLTITKEQTVNYWWAAGLSVLAIITGILGMITAKKWSWLKSGVGQGVFFISLGNLMWGVGQAGWTYYLFKDPNVASPPSKLLDILFMSSIPFWFYGVLKLSKATGAKYGLKKTSGKMLAAALVIIMSVFSYYFLIVVARGGLDYLQGQSIFDGFIDLGYAIGEGIIFTYALVIFGLSWKYLGGRFKYPIIATLIGFGLLYFADFAFSYLDGQGKYYNGDISDLLFLIAFTVFGIGLCLLDPSKKVNQGREASLPIPETAIYSS
jgi:hypothetical protein